MGTISTLSETNLWHLSTISPSVYFQDLHYTWQTINIMNHLEEDAVIRNGIIIVFYFLYIEKHGIFI